MTPHARTLVATWWMALAALAILPAGAALADEVDEVEDVEAVVVPATTTCAEDAGVLAVFGKLHPAMIHLPIAWVALVVLLDLLTFAVGKPDCARFGFLTLGLAVASAIPAIASGLVRGEVLESQPGLEPLVEAHETVMLVMAGVLAVAFVLRLLRRNELVGWTRRAYLGLVLAAALLVAYGAHLGGRVVFGPNHLPF